MKISRNELAGGLIALALGCGICSFQSPPPNQYFFLLHADEAQFGMGIGALISLAAVITLRSRFPFLWRRPVFGFVSFVAIVSGLVEGGVIGGDMLRRRLAPFEIYLRTRHTGVSWEHSPRRPSLMCTERSLQSAPTVRTTEGTEYARYS